MIRLVTDSTAHFLDPDFPRKHNISVVRLRFTSAQKYLKKAWICRRKNFFNGSTNRMMMPTSRAPTLDSISTVYGGLAKPGDEIISIHISE